MIYISTFTYALGKVLGLDAAHGEFQRQLSHPYKDALPCARVIARLRQLDDCGLHHDMSATSIAKARTRAFHEAVKFDPDVYVSVDDDVDADLYTLQLLVESVRGRNAIVIAPCRMRGTNSVNIEFDRAHPGGFTLAGQRATVGAIAGGFGLVAMSREAMTSMVEAYTGTYFQDVDGVKKLALFAEFLEAERWLGEDIAFCRRARRVGVSVEALASGITVHDGVPLRLEEACPRVEC